MCCQKLVKVLHDFVKDVELQTEEWELAWQFLTKTGQISDDTRHEFILLSDILGISALVDTITYPRVEGATESSVLGPFFDDAAHELECGDSICSEDRGEVTLVRGKILDAKTGKPISKAMIDVWETDGDGFYDVQYVEGAGPDFRGRLYTREDGSFDFLAIKPVSYPISNDGPVGALLRALGRHWMRPAHMHFMIAHPEFNKLVTALYTKDDKFVTSDTVFGVKSSLMVDYKWTEDVEMAKKYKITNPEKGFWLLEYDFKIMPKTPPKVLKVKDD